MTIHEAEGTVYAVFVDDDNTLVDKLLSKSIYKIVFTSDEQWRQTRIVIIPTPTFAQSSSILHAFIGIDVSHNGIDAHSAHTFDKGVEVVDIKLRVKATYAIDVAMQHMTFYLASITKVGLKLIATTKFVERSNGCDNLHGAGRAHGLQFVVAVYSRVGIQS